MNIPSFFSFPGKREMEADYISPSGEKLCIYTAVTAGYDPLLAPAFVNPNIDFFVFCDDESHTIPEPWRRLPMDFFLRNPRVTSRYYKLLPHKFFGDYDISMWVDANFLLKNDPWPLIDASLGRGDAAFFRHPDRDCIYKEAGIVVRKKKEHKSIVERQMERYRREGYPSGNGLIYGGIIMRRHNEASVIRAMEDWWLEVSNFAQRDQLSANYVFWKNDFQYSVIPGKYWRNRYFRYYNHRRCRHYLEERSKVL